MPAAPCWSTARTSPTWWTGSGLLSANVNVYPIGDNVISILVRTPNHVETRRDVTIYRAQLEIEIELDTSVRNETDSRQMLISGKCEPGAYIEVDTPYVEESHYINMQTGDFEFLTDLEYIGENTVRFRATMDGRADAEVHFDVNYTPHWPTTPPPPADRRELRPACAPLRPVAGSRVPLRGARSSTSARRTAWSAW